MTPTEISPQIGTFVLPYLRAGGAPKWAVMAAWFEPHDGDRTLGEVREAAEWLYAEARARSGRTVPLTLSFA